VSIRNEIMKFSLLYLSTTSAAENSANCVALGAIYSDKPPSNMTTHCSIGSCN